MDNGIILLSVSSGWMDVLEVLATGTTWSGGGGGGTRPRLASTLEALRMPSVYQFLVALPVVVKSLLDISPDGDDTMRPWHLQDHVGVMWDRHGLGECRLS
jgi:hypothetical protein